MWTILELVMLYFHLEPATIAMKLMNHYHWGIGSAAAIVTYATIFFDSTEVKK